MKEGWKYKRLGDLVKICTGKLDANASDKDGIYPFFTCAEEPLRINNYAYDCECVLVAGNGDLNVKYYQGKFNAYQRTYIIEVKDKNILSTYYLYHFYQLYIDELRKQSVGSTIKYIKLGNLTDSLIPIPSLSEQQSIVEYLDATFAKIETMKANAEKALNEAKALFQSSLKELLEPKEGWEEKTIGELAIDIYRGSGVRKDQVTEDGISCVRYGEIYTKYNFHFDKCHSHTLIEYIPSPKYFDYGDIIFAITGESVEDIGKCAAYVGNEKCIAGGDTVVLKHNQNPRYLAYALSTPSAVKQKGRGKTKLKVVHTNIPSLKEIVLPIAPMAEQILIADTLDTIQLKVNQLQANYDKISQECDALKQSILKQVFE